MKTKEFKDKNPQCAHLKGDALWDAMGNELLKNGEQWVADYSEGAEKELIGNFGGTNFYMNHAKYWSNSATGERLTRKEFDSRKESKYARRDWLSQVTFESSRFDILYFGTNETDQS